MEDDIHQRHEGVEEEDRNEVIEEIRELQELEKERETGVRGVDRMGIRVQARDDGDEEDEI
jgi:hypothetical protein